MPQEVRLSDVFIDNVGRANSVEDCEYIDHDATDEFLAWYKLDMDTPAVQYDSLSSDGLYKLCPELRNHGVALGACLANQRLRLFGRNGTPSLSYPKAQQRFDVSSRLSHLHYPQSCDTLIAFLRLRQTCGDADLLGFKMVAVLEDQIRRRYFESDRSVNFQFARYYSWIDTDPSNSDKPDVMLYDSMQ